MSRSTIVQPAFGADRALPSYCLKSGYDLTPTELELLTASWRAVVEGEAKGYIVRLHCNCCGWMACLVQSSCVHRCGACAALAFVCCTLSMRTAHVPFGMPSTGVQGDCQVVPRVPGRGPCASRGPGGGIQHRAVCRNLLLAVRHWPLSFAEITQLCVRFRSVSSTRRPAPERCSRRTFGRRVARSRK